MNEKDQSRAYDCARGPWGEGVVAALILRGEDGMRVAHGGYTKSLWALTGRLRAAGFDVSVVEGPRGGAWSATYTLRANTEEEGK